MASDQQIDPTEFFAFLESHDEYPASGQHLASEARQEGSEPELAKFFEALPTVNNAGEILEHAVMPEQAPFGRQLDLTNNHLEQEVVPEITPDVTLELGDIVPNDK